MNYPHITSLLQALELLGFDKLEHELIKNICFQLPVFCLHQKTGRGADLINFQLFFKQVAPGLHACLHYDAVFRKAIEIPGTTVNEVELTELDAAFKAVNWMDEKYVNRLEVEKIEDLIIKLKKLESTAEGLEIADRFKVKYWCDTPVQELVNLSSVKQRFEISQRFYFFDDEPAIGVEEAYRFLNNRWMEKQLLAKRKKWDEIQKNDEGVKANGKPTGGLLEKKNKKRAEKSKL